MSPLEKMFRGGLVPLYSSGDPEVLLGVAGALVDAGVPVFEVTLRAPGALGALAELVHRVTDDGLPILVGAGTVLDRAAAEAVVDAGVGFVFSPTVSAEVADVCNAAAVPYIPGCATPTEVHAALGLGCRAVKLFPADLIGPSFIPAVRAVLPGVEFIPSGGITADPGLLRRWFAAGAAAVAMGSSLVSGAAPSLGQLTERARVAMGMVARAREESERE